MAQAFFDESTEQSQIKAKIVSGYFFAWAKVITHIQRSVRKASNKILSLITMQPKKVEQFPLEGYKVTVSRGCFDLEDGAFVVMIKTQFADSNQRCNFQ